MITAGADNQVDLRKVDAIIDSYRGDKSWLVMILQDVQQACNYLPKQALQHVAARLDLPLSHVYRVATFYASFSLTKRGKHLILVCDGTACHLRGSMNLQDEITRELNIQPGQTTADEMFTLERVACLGACALAPVMAVDGKYYGKLTSDTVKATLEAIRRGEPAHE